jgi:hypothetical protein
MIKKIQFLLFASMVFMPCAQLFSQTPGFGAATGLFGSFHYSTMPNRDDLTANYKLDYVTTFKFGGGIEHLTFKSNNFGWGYQMSYWGAGQNYKGIIDSINNINYTAATDLTYAKGALLVHYRSYDRYNPDARFKFSSYLGPYIAFLGTFSDKFELFDKDAKKLGSSSYTPVGFRPDGTGGVGNKDFKAPIYNYLDFGFVIAPGVQYMLTPKFGIAFHIRADISAKNVENTGNIKEKTTIAPFEAAYDQWDELYCKYIPYDPTGTGLIKKPVYDVRPSTKNLTVAAQLTLRFYAEDQFTK